ncbi:MAG: type II secretion system F family protein [Planctomycetaceae bacterium]
MSHDLIWIGTGLLASLFIFGMIQLGMSRQRAHRRNLAEQQFPEMLDLFMQSLRGGADLLTALGVVAEMAPAPGNAAFAQCRDQINAGTSNERAITELVGDQRRFVAHILIAALETGGGNHETLRQSLIRLETLNHHSDLLIAEIDQHLMPIQTTSVALFVLVPAVTFAMLFLSPWYIAALDRHPICQVMLIVAIAFYAFGGCRLFGLWNRQRNIRRILHIE